MTDRTKSYASYLPYLIIAVIGLAIYFNTLFNGYIYDDFQMILDDFRIKDIKNIPLIFTSSEWSFAGPDVVNNYYRPLYLLIFMAEWHIFADQIWGWHLVNILFHIITSGVVFLLFDLLLDKDQKPGSSPGSGASPPGGAFRARTLAFMGSLIFLTHPVVTEPVAWVSSISELSFSLFYLLAFYFYLLAQKRESRSIYILSVLSFLLAAFAKETAMSFPILIAAFDIIIRRKNLWRRIPAYIPFAIVAALYFALRVNALEGMTQHLNMHPYLSGPQYFLNVFPLAMDYMHTLAVPIKLVFFHDFDPVYSIFEARAITALIIVPAAIIIFALLRKRNELFPLSILIFFIPLLPTFYIPALGRDPFAERYLYLPSVGFALLCVLIIKTILEVKATGNRGVKRAVAVAFLSLIAVYSYGTITRVAQWKDTATLLESSVRKDPTNYYALYELGNRYRILGRDREAGHMLERSIEANSQRRDPDPKILGMSRLKLAQVHYNQGNLKKALTLYNEVYRIAPGRYDVNLGLARIYHDTEKLDKAVLHYERALQFVKNPADALGIYINLGNVHAASGRLNKAMENYIRAQKISPDEPIINNNISVIKRRMEMK